MYLNLYLLKLKHKAVKQKKVGIIYRPNTEPLADIDIFTHTLFDILDTVDNEHKHCTILGDMNIDLLKYGTHNKTNEYLDNICSHGYLPMITKPTRISTATATLIDHILTNNAKSSDKSGIIITDVSDHFGTFYITASKHISQTMKNVTQRCFSDANVTKFNDELTKIDFSPVSEIMCPNRAYDQFITLYMSPFNQCFPERTQQVKRKFIKREPWVTSGFLTSSRNKAKLFKKKFNKPTEQNINSYKSYNCIFNKLKRSLKTNYFRQALDDSKYDIKKSWTILREALGKTSNTSDYPHNFEVHNSTITDKKEAADAFNNYFSTIGKQTGDNVPQTNTNFMSYMNNPVVNSMFLSSVDSVEILNFANKLKSKASQDY